ncbi:S-layer homology domain-containing protein [Paenibacillus puldeungensis]|uniref:S-layer homology domain-containing protein n=1 Tax=Paenibacillus puldeungensis TaxID=696536 RepID=A0ABW3RRB0_9BACL
MKQTKLLIKVSKLTLLMVIIIGMTFSGSALATKAAKGGSEQKMFQGTANSEHFKGNHFGQLKSTHNITSASAISQIVKTVGLNLDHVRFVKEPKASDTFKKVKDNAWYAQAFVIANYYGLDIPKDINPSAKVSREQFSHWLYKAIAAKGDYAWTMMYVDIKDSKGINSAYMDSIQKLLNAGIAQLDKNKNFRPNDSITHSEAADMLERTANFLKGNASEQPIRSKLYDVGLTSEKMSGGDILKVTISAMAPHPGYGMEVSSIEYKDGKAVINYRIVSPGKGIYPQVISEVKAETYIPSNYQPVLGEETK